MKKLSIALALILCLVLCVFCFASCKKKNNKTDTTAAPTTGTPTTVDPGTTATEPADTTAPDVTQPPEHTHVRATEYTIDTPATCGAAGSQSYHCTICNEIIPETVVEIPATGNHTLGEWAVTKAPTLIAEGSKSATCSTCNQTITEAIVKTTATVKTFTAESEGAFNDEKLNIKTGVMKDAHFYPTTDDPTGNDLLIEYSILWNDSMLNLLGGSANPYFHTAVAKENGTEQVNNIVYWSPVSDNNNADCKFAGGFEYGTMRTSEEGNPYPKMVPTVGETINSFPNIGGANMGDGEPQSYDQWGWHRVQIRLHVEVTNEAALKADETAGATAATYKCTTTIYIDGIVVSILSSTAMTDKNTSYDNKLFTATSDGQGGIVYSDVRDEAWIHAMRLNSTKAKDDTTVYLVYGDVSMTCGKDFTQKVIKAVDPADATIEVASGVTKSAKAWYKAYDATSHEHVWNNVVEVTKAATLLENGTKVMKCAFCESTETVEYAYSPIVLKWSQSNKSSYSPNETTVGKIRGDKHFYDEGNDLLVEYSFLWNETTVNLRGDKNPYLDTRFVATGENAKNIIYWSLGADTNESDCKFAGGFEYGGISLNEPDNPYPRFNGKHSDITAYPNIGGENNGDGEEQVNNLYGWHRISIRYREEVTNKAALMADTTAGATAATYKLQIWVYIDGKLVIHAYQTDLLSKEGNDRKLFSAASNGEGGIVYTENDSLIVKPVCLNSNRAKDGTFVFYSLADVSATVGSEFVQKIIRLENPTAAQLAVDTGVSVTSTIWYTKLCDEHTWDGNFVDTKAATLLNDGEKVEHCSVCGAEHTVVVPFVAEYTDSKNLAASKYADNQNKDLAILKNAADIRGEDYFYPASTEVGAQGNDLWFEYSFLWNDSLYYRDTPANLAEMRLFAFRSISSASNYRGFYYMYFRNNGDGFTTSGDCPFKGHIDYSTYKSDSLKKNNAIDLTSEGNTLNGRPIGRYAAGWSGGRGDAPYLYDSEWQTLGGWHRLGFRYHQEVESVSGSEVTYAGYTELYIDGVKVWKVLTAMQGFSYKENGVTKYKSLKENNLLLWTATAEDGVITGYTDNDDVRVGLRLDNLAGSSQSVYVGIDDVQWTCGDGFVREVVRVENPKPVKITLPDGNEYDGAMYFTYPHAHVWDEDYTVTTEATLLNEGVKADHCSICGETRETVFAAADPYTISSSMTKDERTAFNTANNVDWLNHDDLKTGIMIKKSINDIKTADQHYYPTEGNDQGNDLLVEVSYLWNNTCSVYDWQTLTFAHVDGYDVFNCGANIVGKDNRKINDVLCDYTYITPTPAEIEADASVKTPSIGGYGWHRLGFRVHQEAAIVADAVKYTYIASAYVDGALVLSIDMTDYVVRRNPTGTVTALLYTAKIEEGNLVYFDIGANPDSTYKTSYAVLMFEEFFNKTGAYCVFTDLIMTCGHDFVQQVKKVADPADANYEITTGVEVSGKIWYEFAD